MARKTQSTRPAKTRRDMYQETTDRICDLLDRGQLPPWRKPWKPTDDGFLPISAAGRPYRGINVWLLIMAAAEKGYSSNRWYTFRQAKEQAVAAARKAGRTIEERQGKRGSTYYWDVDADELFRGGVRKGEKGETVTLWRPSKYRTQEEGSDGELQDVTKRYMLLRHFVGFNAEQCDGLPVDVPAPQLPIPPDTPADEVFAAYVEREGIAVGHGGDRAYYEPRRDRIQLPPREAFRDDAEYHSTVLHEAAHSTGHASRLARKGITEISLSRSHQYTREELVAEFASAMLCGLTGVATDSSVENSAAYCRGWAAKLRDDPKLLVIAAAQAQKAADLVLDVAAYQEVAEETREAA